MCLPRFDSPSCFNRLLDWEQGGYCAILPTAPFRTRRFYHLNTAILTTEFRTFDGLAQLTDLMPVTADGEPAAVPHPSRQVLRRLEVLEGTI